MAIDLVDVELGEVGTDALEAGICSWQARLSAATAVYVLAVAEFDRRKGWGPWECRSMAHWLNWRCGTSLVTAREQVRVGNALAGLPVIRRRFCAGELSYSQVRAVTRVADGRTDELLADLAQAMTASQLEEVVRAFRRTGQIDDDRSTARRQARSVSWHYDDDGMLVGRFRLPAEEGAVLVKAIEESLSVEDAVAAESDGADGWPAARADALVGMAEDRLARLQAGQPEEVGDRCTVTVLVDDSVLQGRTDDCVGVEDRVCQVDGGPGLAPDTARRLACDQPTVTVHHDGLGGVLDVGRRTRRIGRRLRRALERRDRGCRYPGCTTRRTQAHHIVHWVDGGHTTMENPIHPQTAPVEPSARPRERPISCRPIEFTYLRLQRWRRPRNAQRFLPSATECAVRANASACPRKRSATRQGSTGHTSAPSRGVNAIPRY